MVYAVKWNNDYRDLIVLDTFSNYSATFQKQNFKTLIRV